MTLKTANIFNQTLDRVKKGENISVALSSYPQATAEQKQEIVSLLSLASAISALPKRAVPEPIKRKLFLEYQPVHFKVFGYTRISMFVRKYNLAPLIVAAFVVIITGTTYAATNSLPGSTFFSIKKAYENIHLALTSNPEDKVALQVEIAAQRLSDAQKVFNQQDANSSSQQQALTELNNQTNVALNNVKGVAAAISSKNPGLVNQVAQITKNKNSLLAQVDPKIAAQSAAQSNSTLNAIEKIVAATDEQNSTTNIQPQPNVTTTGTITAINGDAITISGNDFTIDTAQFSPYGYKTLAVNDLVKVTAKLEGDKNIISSIVKTGIAVPQTDARSQPGPTATGSAKGNSADTSPPQQISSQKIQDTFGGFILESPAPTVSQ